MERDYKQIVTELKRTFANGTVQFRSDNNRPYIPNQVYTDRVESATESRWNLEIKELEINVPHRYVKSIVKIEIDVYSRDGYGFAVIPGDPATEPKNITTAVDQAVNEAYLTALDTYQMGWRDLAPYKKNDWAGNPALQHLLEHMNPGNQAKIVHSKEAINRTCLVCNKVLTADEWELLSQVPNLNREKMTYCFEHIPDHLKRKINKDTLRKFEA
ncbi:hypothetical protein Q0V21_31015 [Paenibacillus sp. 11B]|uniref:hypothetical protein n=1 Tax=Paenibacillus sp. 11B TaxID=3060965 RepID=UPI00264D4359|nr:hypothetical protein [Paenibacillus sp. 11B]MDN8593162.1 hypothetical protein [Paenibacillus sp. 11B]